MCQENILMKVISSYLDPTFPCFSPCRFYSICRCDVLLSESSVCRDPVAGESSVFCLFRWRHLVSGFLNSVPHGLLSLWACWQIIQQVSICSWKTKWCGIRLNQAKNIYRKCNRKQIILPGALSWITTRMPIMMFCVLLTCWSVCTHAHIRSYSLYLCLLKISYQPLRYQYVMNYTIGEKLLIPINIYHNHSWVNSQYISIRACINNHNRFISRVCVLSGQCGLT